jgi:hypothetical protein
MTRCSWAGNWEQMRSLFGEGTHPNPAALQAWLIARGMAARGRRPGDPGLVAVSRAAGFRRGVRTVLAAATPSRRRGCSGVSPTVRGFRRASVRPVGSSSVGTHERLWTRLSWSLGAEGGRRGAVAGYDLVFTPVKSVTALWGIGSPMTGGRALVRRRIAVGALQHSY